MNFWPHALNEQRWPSLWSTWLTHCRARQSPGLSSHLWSRNDISMLCFKEL